MSLVVLELLFSKCRGLWDWPLILRWDWPLIVGPKISRGPFLIVPYHPEMFKSPCFSCSWSESLLRVQALISLNFDPFGPQQHHGFSCFWVTEWNCFQRAGPCELDLWPSVSQYKCGFLLNRPNKLIKYQVSSSDWF